MRYRSKGHGGGSALTGRGAAAGVATHNAQLRPQGRPLPCVAPVASAAGMRAKRKALLRIDQGQQSRKQRVEVEVVVEHCALAQHEPTVQQRKGKRAGTAVHADCDAESRDPERDEVRHAGHVRRRDGYGKPKVEVKAWHEH